MTSKVKMNSQGKQTAAEKASQFNLLAFFSSVKAELSKITWTSQEELKVYTQVVVTATFASGLVLYFMDVLIQRTLFGFDAIMRMIIG